MHDGNDKPMKAPDTGETGDQSRGKQEQSDPQHTELRGFVNPNDDLEPTLTDGTKAPEKAHEEHKKNSGGSD